MKSEEIYNAWKKQKSEIDIRGHLADKLISKIYQYEREKRKPLFDGHRLVELISGHWFVKAGLVTTGAVVGFVRVMFLIDALLMY